MIENTAGQSRRGCYESHTVENLAPRLGTTVETVLSLLASGALTGSQLLKGRDDGPRVYSSDDLNRTRAALCASVAADAIEQVNASPDHLAELAQHALREFSRKPRTVELGRDEDRSPSAVVKVARVLGGAAILGGAGAYIRGRAAGLGKPGLGGIVATARSGAALLPKDILGSAGTVREIVSGWRQRAMRK